VESQEVVPVEARAADRWSMVEATMRAVPVVVVKPGKKMLVTVLRILIQAGVGPFPQSGLNEAFAHAQTTATMTSPADGSTDSGTITISASISGSYTTVVFWRDNWVQIGQSSSPQLSYNTSTLSSGSHQFFVSVLDSAGNTLCASNIVTVTVQSSGGPLPTPPSNATEYANLQNQSGNPGAWTVCDGSCSGSGGTGRVFWIGCLPIDRHQRRALAPLG
jgi:Big-like domain-containing protein